MAFSAFHERSPSDFSCRQCCLLALRLCWQTSAGIERLLSPTVNISQGWKLLKLVYVQCHCQIVIELKSLWDCAGIAPRKIPSVFIILTKVLHLLIKEQSLLLWPKLIFYVNSVYSGSWSNYEIVALPTALKHVNETLDPSPALSKLETTLFTHTTITRSNLSN